MNLNKVLIAGNLTRDIETRYTPKGLAVGKFGIAINRKWKSDGGETKEEVTFIDVDAFGRTAEVIAQYLKKGDPIFIEGRLKLDQWEDKQTHQKRSKLCVVAESFQFAGQAKGDRSAPKPESTPASEAPKPDAAPEEDDVPF